MTASGYLTRPLRSYEQALADIERNQTQRHVSGARAGESSLAPQVMDSPAPSGDGMSVNFEAVDD